MLVDSIKVYNKFYELRIPCGSCGEYEHHSKKCDLINYKPIPLKIIKIFQENRYQKRKFVTRNKRKLFQALKDQFHVESQVGKFNQFESTTIEDFHYKYLAAESELDSSSNSESLPAGEQVESFERLGFFLNLYEGDFDILETEENKECQEDEIRPPIILVKQPSEKPNMNKKDDHSPTNSNKKDRKTSADGEFFSKNQNIIGSFFLLLEFLTYGKIKISVPPSN